MLKHRFRRLAVVLGVLSLTAAGVVVVAGSSNAASNTKKLHGKMVDIQNFGGPGCSSPTGVCSRFTAKGDIKGEGLVEVETFPAADAPGYPAYSRANTVITTKKGNLTCNEAALFDVPGEDHAFVDLCIISGGTGIYEGATGYIQEVGTFDFANNLGELEYYGKITFADE
jgi:hypothetical protein